MKKPSRRALAWLPLMATLGLGCTAALGVSLVPGAAAVTDTSNVIVSASVAREIHATIGSGTCGTVTGTAPNGLVGTMTQVNLTTASVGTSLGTCRVSFGTNTAVGGGTATLSIQNGLSTTAEFFCVRATSATAACTAGTNNTFTDKANSPACTTGCGTVLNGAAASGEAGVRIVGTTSGCGIAAGWGTGTTSGFVTNTLTGADQTGTFRDVPKAAASNVCVQTTAGATDGVVSFEFAVNPGTAQGPGTYYGKAALVATAT